jgi:hypothetical protein
MRAYIIASLFVMAIVEGIILEKVVRMQKGVNLMLEGDLYIAQGVKELLK